MMMQESVAILVIGVLLAAVFVRSKHYGYALAVVPVLFLPVLHLLIRMVLYFSKGVFFGIRPAVITAFVDFIAIALACVFTVLFSRRIQARRTRAIYLIMMLAYTVILGWVYVFTALRILFV